MIELYKNNVKLNGLKIDISSSAFFWKKPGVKKATVCPNRWLGFISFKIASRMIVKIITNVNQLSSMLLSSIACKTDCFMLFLNTKLVIN
ncbi:hypothetical protein T190115A13A_20278 [Tenacibaculum sp. 190524A02b]|uniref:Uncharacterized protein n=1 Tax=Tenacibaculum vairaonense TaxID=3137860 RepID=A0ABP1F9D3_9FLAO